MAIVWDDTSKRNLLDIGSALNPRWGRPLSAGVDLFENMFLDTDPGSGGQINTGCSKTFDKAHFSSSSENIKTLKLKNQLFIFLSDAGISDSPFNRFKILFKVVQHVLSHSILIS
ncbi:MAG: hypothetical protein P1P72_02885 [ANME-2 cluster archaeon]|nr:hypothetical protein [ANME-2 cluster archaeon]